MNEELVSLGDLAKELDINKSKLNYYAWIRLITPLRTIGKTMVFDKAPTVKRLKEIQSAQKKGVKLRDIVKNYANS